MKMNDLFPSNFLKKEDLAAGPKAVPIGHVAQEEIQGDGGKELKPVLHFAHTLKPLILNMINYQSIAALYGDETDGWPGKVIEAYADPNIMFGPKRVGGVRVRAPQVTTTAARSAPAPHHNGTAAGPLWDVSDGTKPGTATRQTTDQVIDRLQDMADRGVARSAVKVRDQNGLVVSGEQWWTIHAPVTTDAPGDFIPF
jgi:hypothetical protein